MHDARPLPSWQTLTGPDPTIYARREDLDDDEYAETKQETIDQVCALPCVSCRTADDRRGLRYIPIKASTWGQMARDGHVAFKAFLQIYLDDMASAGERRIRQNIGGSDGHGGSNQEHHIALAEAFNQCRCLPERTCHAFKE